MRLTNRVAVLSVAALIAGCSAYNTEPKSIVLPTSNKSIDLIQHRSDVRLMDCGTLVVLQTYDATGRMIDSKDARGNAFHCAVVPALIEAGGRVGGAYVGRSPISISNSQAQGQQQGQIQLQHQTAAGGAGGAGGQGGQGGQGGNNGQGNGDNDGTNNGTDNHHNNGDNN